MKRISVALVCVVMATGAAARELPSYFKGVRPLGMGGAFTAVADDESALFYNPAGLDRVQTWRLGVLNPLLEVGEKGADFYQDAQDADLDNTSEVTDLLRDYMGQYLHYRAALFPNFVMRHFALGVLAQSSVNVEPHNLAFPEADVDAFATLGAHAGLGYGLWDGKLLLGVSGKYVKAYRLQEVYDAAEIAADDFQDRIDEDTKSGGGFGFDVGAMVVLPILLEPALALTVLNVADTDLGDAGALPQQINVGASVSHEFPWLRMTAAADWVDVGNNVGTDEDLYKRLHFGVEGRFAKILSVRAGIHQGYGTVGASVDFRLVKLDYATYAEEIGSAAGDRSDRRHVVQLTLGW